MSFLLDGIRCLTCLHKPKPEIINKGDSQLDIIIEEAKQKEIIGKVEDLKNIAIRKARILTRLNFLVMFITTGISLYSGIYNVPVLAVIAGIFQLVMYTLQWGTLSESYGRIAVRLTSILNKIKVDPSLINDYYIKDIEDLESEVESTRIVTYLWS